jgi:hypothetical protein
MSSKTALVLDTKSGKMVTPAQAKVLAVLDITGLDYAAIRITTSDAAWFEKWVASGRSLNGVTRPGVHYGSAKALEAAGLVQVYADYMDTREIQVRRIENARPLPVYTTL